LQLKSKKVSKIRTFSLSKTFSFVLIFETIYNNYVLYKKHKKRTKQIFLKHFSSVQKKNNIMLMQRLMLIIVMREYVTRTNA